MEAKDASNLGTSVSAKGVTFIKLTAKSDKAFEKKLFLEDNPKSAYGPNYRLVLPNEKKSA